MNQPEKTLDFAAEVSERTGCALSLLSLLEDLDLASEGAGADDDPNDPEGFAQKQWAVRRALKAELMGLDLAHERQLRIELAVPNGAAG